MQQQIQSEKCKKKELLQHYRNGAPYGMAKQI